MKLTAKATFIVLLFIMLVGCQMNEAELPTTDSSGTNTAATLCPTKSTEPEEIRPVPPKNPGSSLIAYDPDRQIYIDSQHVYMDYYDGISRLPSFNFSVFSKTYLKTEDITVTFPVDLPFVVNVTHIEGIQRKTSAMLDNNFTDRSGGELVLPYYVYQAYRNVDFKVKSQIENGLLQEDEPEAVIAAEREARIREDFANLEAEDIPEFYVYNINVAFVNIQGIQETIVLENVYVTVEEQTYEAKLGRVRLFPKEQFPVNTPIAKFHGATGNFYGLYNDGLVYLYSAFTWENIKEDITLTGLQLAEEESQVLEIIINTVTPSGAVEFTWDGKTPIYLYEGDSIDISIILRNDLTAQLRSRVYFHAVLKYTNEKNEEVCAVSSRVKGGGWNFYECYAIIFDGVDMAPYYRDYLYGQAGN